MQLSALGTERVVEPQETCQRAESCSIYKMNLPLESYHHVTYIHKQSRLRPVFSMEYHPRTTPFSVELMISEYCEICYVPVAFSSSQEG